MAPMKKKHGRPTTGGQRLDRLPQIRGPMYQHLGVTNLKFHLSEELSSEVSLASMNGTTRLKVNDGGTSLNILDTIHAAKSTTVY